ncbi:MAG: TonB-dependent receptor [Flavisolibacter sp.]
MRILFSVLLFLTASISAYAQTLRGSITDAISGLPIAGVRVGFSATEFVTTANDGSFQIACRENALLTADRSGYESWAGSIKNCSQQIEIRLQPLPQMLERVEITATSNQNKLLLYQPQSIAKISTGELHRGNGLFLSDAIQTNVPGVMMNRRTVSAGQQFNIRGYGNGVRGTNGPASNFDGQGYKVYLNGMPVTDAEGVTMMDDIDFGSMGNVEVLKGPAGSLYGLAIAGVVNLRTQRAPAGKTALSQDVLIGSYGLKRFTTSFLQGRSRSSLLVNYGYQQSEGFMLHNASEKRFVNAAGEFDLNEKQKLNFYAAHTASYEQRGGELTVAQYNSGDYSGNSRYIKNNAHSQVNAFRGSVGHTWQFSPSMSNTTTLFGSALQNDVSSAGGWTDRQPVGYGLRSTMDVKLKAGEKVNISGITGIETQTQWVSSQGFAMSTNPADPSGYNIITNLRSNQQVRSGTTSLFTEWTALFPGDLSFTAGIGSSQMKIELNDRIYAAGKPSYFYKKYGDMLSPRLAVNKVFNKSISVYASYSTAFKAPVSSYFYIPYATGVDNTGIVNTGLLPEKGVQVELGSKGSIGNDKLSYQLAIFQTRFQNKMAAVAVPNADNTATLYSYIVNSGSQLNKGLEALVRYRLVDQTTGWLRYLQPFGNVTYSDFKYDNYKFQFSGTAAPVDYTGVPVAGVAKLVANLGADFQLARGFYGNVVYNYKDPVNITLDGAYRSSSYNLLNARLGWRKQLANHFDVDLFAGADNITGQQHYLMVFVNQLPDAYIPAPRDAVFYGGLSVKYIF